MVLTEAARKAFGSVALDGDCKGVRRLPLELGHDDHRLVALSAVKRLAERADSCTADDPKLFPSRVKLDPDGVEHGAGVAKPDARAACRNVAQDLSSPPHLVPGHHL